MNASIVGYARTPFCRSNGQLAEVPATSLGAHAAAAALRRAGISPASVNAVIGGQVLQAGAGQNPARQSAVAAGVPLTTPAITVNAVCLSGMEAVVAGTRLIASGEADIVLAFGQVSMSQAPHAANLRRGTRFGAMELIDTMQTDGLTEASEGRSMGSSTEEGNATYRLDRACQDQWGAWSHQRAEAHADALAQEIEPYPVMHRGRTTLIDADDGVRSGVTTETLASLRPAFSNAGTITAGNSSPITDGAAAIILASPKAVREHGLQPLATLESHALVSGPDLWLHNQPAAAIDKALSRVAIDRDNLSVVEINEAFAAVSVQSTRELGLDPKIVNRFGGAIALGHPIGASGARLIGTLAQQLHAIGNGAWGAAGICGGGGQGSAVILRAC